MRFISSILFCFSLTLSAQAATSPSDHAWRQLLEVANSQVTLNDLAKVLPFSNAQREEFLKLLRMEGLNNHPLPKPKLIENGIQFDTDYGPLKIQTVSLSEQTYLVNGRHLKLQGLTITESFYKIRQSLDKAFGLAVWNLLLPIAHAESDLAVMTAFLAPSMAVDINKVLNCVGDANAECPGKPLEEHIPALTQYKKLKSFSCDENGYFREASNKDFSITQDFVEVKGVDGKIYKSYYARVFGFDAENKKQELCNVKLSQPQEFNLLNPLNKLCQSWETEFKANRSYSFDNYGPLVFGKVPIPVLRLSACCKKKGCEETIRKNINLDKPVSEAKPSAPSSSASGRK